MMANIKGTGELSDMLADFENEAMNSISAELQRIGRSVRMDEMAHIPFNEDIQSYVEAIRLDALKVPLLDTSFRDTNEKYLSAFIADSEIGHWDLIALLGMLQDIK